jgi:hypothetical protein
MPESSESRNSLLILEIDVATVEIGSEPRKPRSRTEIKRLYERRARGAKPCIHWFSTSGAIRVEIAPRPQRPGVEMFGVPGVEALTLGSGREGAEEAEIADRN